VPVSPTLVSSSSPTATAAASPGRSLALTPAAGEFVNPVIRRDFPDPHVINVDGTYFAYATNDGIKNLQVARSEDLVDWEILQDALPGLASWSGLTPLFSDAPHKATWAPAAAQIDDRFVLYYTTPALEMERPDGRPSQCIGVAVADDPAGPFVDESDDPIVCQAELGGSIDSTYFRDEDGSQYLIWKNDGNCCRIETKFYIQELTPDGSELIGEPTDMGVSNDTTWEQHVIEAPTLIAREGTYYLFFSGNDFASAAYAVGYATSDDVLGPYQDAEENPILASEGAAAGPGHQSVLEDEDGDLWMTYHAWDAARVGYHIGGQRSMWIDPLVIEDGTASVQGPTAGPQPAPEAP
jgi:beta-xylosidase